MCRMLEFDTIYDAYLNESAFKYYISILGGGGLRSCLFCLFWGVGVQNSGKPAYIILAHSLIHIKDYNYHYQYYFHSYHRLQIALSSSFNMIGYKYGPYHCFLLYLPWHCSPWCKSPYSRDPQWSQNAGLE